MKVFKTRLTELGFVQLSPGCWQFVSLGYGEPSQTGPHYASKAELLADLTRFAKDYGLTE